MRECEALPVSGMLLVYRNTDRSLLSQQKTRNIVIKFFVHNACIACRSHSGNIHRCLKLTTIAQKTLCVLINLAQRVAGRIIGSG